MSTILAPKYSPINRFPWGSFPCSKQQVVKLTIILHLCLRIVDTDKFTFDAH